MARLVKAAAIINKKTTLRFVMGNPPFGYAAPGSSA
jgi:hypothetical protein